jgi:hypothetical protein
MTAQRLLAALLASQPQPETELDEASFAAAVHDCLSRGQDLPPDLAALVWLRPDARRLYTHVRADIVRDFTRRWQAGGGAMGVERLAASAPVDEAGSAPEAITARGFTVTTHQDRGSGRWLISLVLEPDLAAEFPAGLGVELRDSGDLVWLSGSLDRLGGIDAWWPHEENPRQRLRHHQLQLAFV